MKEYKKELNKYNWFSNWWEEKIIFTMNEQISNFGRSWFQSLLWLFIISLLFFNFIEEQSTLFLIFQIAIAFILYFFTHKLIKKFKMNFNLVPHSLVLFYLFYITNGSIISTLNELSHFINPASYNDYYEKGYPSFWAFHKSLIAITIYHFTISLRRQTKR